MKNIKCNFKEKIKQQIEIDNTYQKDQFMEMIKDDPNLLKFFSLERLMRIREYWENRVAKEQELLINMKKNHETKPN